jgi:hypothetical protein
MRLKLHPPDLQNLADDRVDCPVCNGTGAVGLGDGPPDVESTDECDNCEGKGTVIRPTGRKTLSHSSIGTQLACLRRFGYAYEDRLELIARPAALSLGAAFAKAIEHGDPGIGMQALAAEREVHDQEDHDRLAKDMAVVGGAAKAYLDRYRDYAQVYDAGLMANEVEYLVRLRNPETGHYSNTFDLHGRADGVIDHGDFLELIEDKLVGALTAQMVKRVRLDRQVSLESYALWRITGKPVRKIRYRHTRKPSIKQRQNESVEDFCQRVLEDYESRPDFYLHEETTYRDADDLLLIEQELWSWAKQRREAMRDSIWPRNVASCDDYGGCAFLPSARLAPTRCRTPWRSTGPSPKGSRDQDGTTPADGLPEAGAQAGPPRSGRTANNIALRAGLPNGQYIGRCLDRLREKGYIETDAEPQEVDGKARGGKWVRARG